MDSLTNSLGSKVAGSRNSFLLLRYLFAVMVIFYHSYVFGGSQDKLAFSLTVFSNNTYSLGNLAVFGFLVISGFLVTQSYLRTPKLTSFLLKRVLRIFPAFTLALVLCAFLLGPLLSNYDYGVYFRSFNADGPYAFFWKNLTFNIAGYQWGVLDVFLNNPVISSINGSMWTLKHEFLLYLFLPVLGFFLMFKYNKLLFVLLGICVALAIFAISGVLVSKLPFQPYWLFSAGEYSRFIELSVYFLWGAIFFVFQEKILLSFRWFLLALGIFLLGGFLGNLHIVSLFCLPYIVIYLAYQLKFFNLERYGDLSYGMYIFAFPIGQMLVTFFPSLNFFVLFGATVGLTSVVAFFSWHLVEKPFLSLKGHFLK